MLARARRLLGPDVPLVRRPLPDLGVDGRFDAAVCTLDGINYLEPVDLPPTFASLSARLRPDGWLVFDVHTDAMMALTASRPVVTGEKDGYRFTITSAVDPDARASDTRIEITPPEGPPLASSTASTSTATRTSGPRWPTPGSRRPQSGTGTPTGRQTNRR